MNVLHESATINNLSSFNDCKNTNYIFRQYITIKTIAETMKGGDPIGV